MGNQCFTTKEEEPVFKGVRNPSVSRKKSSVCIIDWNSESSVTHRSAINCLHNYAIGKILAGIESSQPIQHHPTKQRSLDVQLRFSQELHQEIIIERELLSVDAGRDGEQSDPESVDGNSFASHLTSSSCNSTDAVDANSIHLSIAERKISDKPFKRRKPDVSQCTEAWDRSNFTESAPDFGVGQLFHSSSRDLLVNEAGSQGS